MSELRQDFTTGEWVIIAPERAKRPNWFSRPKQQEDTPEWDENCPFCPGNEAGAPPEVFRIEDDNSGWRTRVVPNRYPALTPEGSTARQVEEGFFKRIQGIGVHEVVIESRHHNVHLAELDVAAVRDVLITYRARYNQLKSIPFIRFISVFKNQGERAGTSLQHPHSQVVATPVAPPYIRRKLDIALRYYDDMNTCLYCDMFHHEAAVGRRVVAETEHFLVFHPYASHTPFESWIVPRNHETSFGLIPDDRLKELAGVLKTTLWCLQELLGDPDYNYIICNSPTEDEQNRYYDWHVMIIPRLTTPAGFEMGSGIYINTVPPEEAATLVRGASA